MLLNKGKLRLLMDEYSDGNYNRFAKKLGVEPAQLHRFLNDEHSQAGALFLGRFMVFCESNSLQFKEYIFLPEVLTVVNESTGTDNN